MNTCKTCQHWGSRYGMHGHKKRCDHIVSGVPDSALVAPIHDNNYLSDLFTGPDFGCLHHAPKMPIDQAAYDRRAQMLEGGSQG